MSERGSFVTEYIYCEDCRVAAQSVLLGQTKYLCSAFVHSWEGDEGKTLPIIAGKIGGLYPGEELHDMVGYIEELQPELCHDLRICVLAETGQEIFTAKAGNT